MTPRIVFQAFLLSLAALTTTGSAQTRAATSVSVIPESSELFPADHTSTAAPAASDWSPTRVESRPLAQVAGQAAAQDANSKLPPPPVGENTVPTPAVPYDRAPASGGNSGPMGSSTMMGGDCVGSPQMTPVDQVFVDGDPGCGSCGPTECCSDWCKKCWWFGKHSTCDMPQHFPYPPEFHGYYYFLPYNYVHVLQHQQIAPMLGSVPFAPYETDLQKVYVDAVGEKEATRPAGDGVLKPLNPDTGKLPDLEELLGGKHDLDMPRGPSKKTVPPKPGLQPKGKGGGDFDE
jgi:hypothetical protein